VLSAIKLSWAGQVNSTTFIQANSTRPMLTRLTILSFLSFKKVIIAMVKLDTVSQHQTSIDDE
jgi:uncharacterized OB-fold protein